jgi:hypothetical protein
VQQPVSSVAVKDLTGPLLPLVGGVAPFEVRVHRLYNPEGITQQNIVPSLMGIILTMTMVMMTGLAMTRERERGTMENLLATPVNPLEVMTGKIVPYIFIGLIQSTSILLAARYLFHVPVAGSFLKGNRFRDLWRICGRSWPFTRRLRGVVSSARRRPGGRFSPLRLPRRRRIHQIRLRVTTSSLLSACLSENQLATRNRNQRLHHCFAFACLHTSFEGLDGVSGKDPDALLMDNSPAVVLGIYEMHRRTGLRLSRDKYRLEHAIPEHTLSPEFGKQSGMGVQNPRWKRG